MVPNIILAISPVEINVAFHVMVMLEPSLNTINGSVAFVASDDVITAITLITATMSAQQ